MRRNHLSPRTDLRRWLSDVANLGELKSIDEVDWDREIGTLVELNAQARGAALLFDKIRDYSAGYRILAGSMSSAKRLILTLGLPAELEGLELIRFMKERMHQWSSTLSEFPVEEAKDGLVFENVQDGEAVDLFQFPAPLWHEEDGGRYIYRDRRGLDHARP